MDKANQNNQPTTIKLIDEKDWNIITSVPNEFVYFHQGHPALNIISVIGGHGSGKSSLLNKIANKTVFNTFNDLIASLGSHSSRGTSRNFRLQNRHQPNITKHTTRGIDLYPAHERILLDCQPLLSSSILEEHLSTKYPSPLSPTSLVKDPITLSYISSLQLTTFLFAISDYVILVNKWLIDVNILKLISTSLMIIGEGNLRSKLIIYAEDERLQTKLKPTLDLIFGRNVIDNIFCDHEDLIDYVKKYSEEKCKKFRSDPRPFTGKNWLESCQRVWVSSIKNSSMFADYAHLMDPASSIA